MTLESLAHEAFGNLDRKGFVSQIENGKRPVSSLTARRLVDALELSEDILDLILSNDPVEDDTPTPADENAAKMIAAAETEGTGGVAEALLIALAYDYAEGDAADLQGAYKGLRAALETAREMAARADLPDNTDAALSAVRAAVQRLNEAGDPDAAAAVIDDALAQQKAGMAATLELGIQQDRLRNEPEAAAEKVVQQVRLDVGEGEMFDALRVVFAEWYEYGRDAGLNFELEVAIALARASLSIANGFEQRGTAGNDLGVALVERGERESGTARLEEAVAAYRAALEERTRDKVPLQWAMTQMNLGAVRMGHDADEPWRCAAKPRGARKRNRAVGRGSGGLSRGVGGTDAGNGAVEMGHDADEPWQCADEPRGARKRNRAVGGGRGGLSRSVGGEHAGQGATGLGKYPSEPLHSRARSF